MWENLIFALYAKHKWLSGCAETNDLLGLIVNYIVILAATLP
jgi:hypothetical protein